jgi:catechol 2,3-dioxygenase-like lactoylglutathione lyase family enzyme
MQEPEGARFHEEQMLMRIDHFAFEVSDLEAALKFYIDRLGFRLETTFMDPQEHETLAVLETAGGKLELIQALDEKNQPQSFEPITLRKHFCPHLALQVDDIEKTLADLRRQEVPLLRGPLEIPEIVKWFYVCDPDRNVIEFFQDFR